MANIVPCSVSRLGERGNRQKVTWAHGSVVTIGPRVTGGMSEFVANQSLNLRGNGIETGLILE